MVYKNYVLAEYIWIGGHGEVRSKTRVIHGKDSVTLKDLPKWNYDGSSTDQAPGTDSEVIIIPRAVYADPFRRNGNHVLVVTDTYAPTDGKLKPIPTNSRNLANEIFNSKVDEEPWFGIEQEYTLFQDGRPLGWPKSKARSTGNPTQQIGYPAPQGPYYCGAGADRIFGRDMVEAHLEYCAYAGLKVSGINAEVMPGQWEFQVGPCVGIDAGDMLTAARYILYRVAENFKIAVSLDPKPIPGDWNGAGCHTNFSTKAMREEPNSLNTVIYPAVERLGKRHQQHINAYGEGNDQRLTGRHETAGIDKFTYGVADRGASIRIPNQTSMDGKGYFEDRRPASNMDPYVVTSMIFDSAILDGQFAERFAEVKTAGVDVDLSETPVEAKPSKEVPTEVVALEKAEKAAAKPTKKASNPSKAKTPKSPGSPNKAAKSSKSSGKTPKKGVPKSPSKRRPGSPRAKRPKSPSAARRRPSPPPKGTKQKPKNGCNIS